MNCDLCNKHYENGKPGYFMTIDGVFCKDSCLQQHIDKIATEFNGSTDHSSIPQCPYCGYYVHNWEWLKWQHTTRSGYKSEELECGRCMKPFTANLYYQVYFSTEKNVTLPASNNIDA